MKKLLTRVIALALVAFLFAAPSVASAESKPVCFIDSYGVKGFEFLPDWYDLSSGKSIALWDLTSSDGRFHVPAGKQATYNVTLGDDPGSYRVKIYWPGHGTVFNGIINDDINFHIILPKILIDATYEISVTALSNISISSYSQFLD
jgi:hypothetical protein